MLTVYTNGGRKNEAISMAFAAGCAGRVLEARDGLQPGAAAFYGMLRGLRALLGEARDRKREWYYLDNGYFGRDRFYRVTRGALQLPHPAAGVRTDGYQRMYDHALPWQQWRAGGVHVLVTLQTDAWYELAGEGSKEAWIARVALELGRHTDRPVRWREKGARAPLADDLRNAWALVTHASNTALEALIAGVPVFVLGQSAAAPLGLTDLARIENPRRFEDRLPLMQSLAANQWTIAEMRSGACWRDLQTVARR